MKIKASPAHQCGLMYQQQGRSHNEAESHILVVYNLGPYRRHSLDQFLIPLISFTYDQIPSRIYA